MDRLPYISILMPIQDESAYIRRSLGAVLAQDYPTDCMQIIVADGMSTDGTRQIVQAFQAEHINIQLIDNPRKIVPTGLNAALLQAQGEIILRVDGHCEIAPNYGRNCVHHLVDEKVDGVGGAMVTLRDTPLAQTIAVAISSSFGVGGSAFRTTHGKSMLVDSVPFPAYTRQFMARAGLYDEELLRNQDDEYNYRLRKLGAKILLADDVYSKYYSRGSLRSLWRQYFQYGYWKVRVLQKHPRQMRSRQFVPPAFVTALLLLGVLAIPFPIARFTLFLLAGVYLTANLAASLYTSARRGWRHLLLLPLIYMFLHISYGLGFLVGLVMFAKRWGDKEGNVSQWTPDTHPF